MCRFSWGFDHSPSGPVEARAYIIVSQLMMSSRCGVGGQGGVSHDKAVGSCAFAAGFWWKC